VTFAGIRDNTFGDVGTDFNLQNILADKSVTLNLQATNNVATVGQIMTLLGGQGNDSITGSAGDDIIIGNSGNDIIKGGGGDDIIYGGGGNDIIDGGDGNDTIYGGAGNDIITGGAGADRFVLTETASSDTILDFSSAAGANADVLVFDISSLGLLAADYAAGAGVVITAAEATSLAAGLAANHIIIDTATNIFNMLDADSAWAGGALAIESDSGRVLFDADANFNDGAVQIGLITKEQVAGITAGNLEFIA
jgi:Ca2+-binding RTX toxin-like protein